MKKIKHLFGVVVFCLASSSQADWTSFYQITGNYFQPIGTTDQSIILEFGTAFHECGWNNAAEVKASLVGMDYFKTITSVILSAILANKQISILTSGDPGQYCNGTKAKIISIRIQG